MVEKKNRRNKLVVQVQGIPDSLTGCWITDDVGHPSTTMLHTFMNALQKTQGQEEPVNSHNAVIQVSTETPPLAPNSLITDSKSGDANPSYTRQSFQPISPGVKPSHCDSYGDTVPCGKPTSRRPSRTQDGNINPSAIGVGSVNTRASVSQKQPLSINTDVSFPLDTAFYTSNLSFEDTFPSDMSSDGTTSSASSSPPRGVIPTPESTVSNQFYLGVSDNFRGIAGISVWEGNPYDSPIGPLRLDEMCLPQGKMYGTLCGDSYTPPDTGLYDGITDFQNTQYVLHKGNITSELIHYIS